MKVGISLANKAKWEAALLVKGDEARKVGTKVIEQIGSELESLIVEKLAAENSDTGHLLQSIQFQMTEKLKGEIGTSVEYAPYIEFGTNAHRPPFQPLYEWAWRKRKDIGLEDEEVEGFAIAICNKIAEQGTQAGLQWTRSIEEIKPIFNKLLAKAINEVMKK